MQTLSRTARKLLEIGLARDGLICPPPRSARALGAAATLLRHGLLKELETVFDQLAWRRDDEGQAWCLALTAAGRRAVPARAFGCCWKPEGGCAMESCQRTAPCEGEWADDITRIIKYGGVPPRAGRCEGA